MQGVLKSRSHNRLGHCDAAVHYNMLSQFQKDLIKEVHRAHLESQLKRAREFGATSVLRSYLLREDTDDKHSSTLDVINKLISDLSNSEPLPTLVGAAIILDTFSYEDHTMLASLCRMPQTAKKKPIDVTQHFSPIIDSYMADMYKLYLKGGESCDEDIKVILF
jgi:hypothetical protein